MTSRTSRREPFMQQLQQRWQALRTLLCVGLDPDIDRIPASYQQLEAADASGLLQFCCDIVDATAPFVCAFKPQFAHFAALGKENELAGLISYIHQQHPGIPVILDAKRGDIGSTAERYAVEAFERYDADAVTVNPYLGPESLMPYLAYPDRGTVVLCRTSNQDSDWLQNEPAADPAYLRVARAAVGWNTHGNLMLVAGATQIDELAAIRGVVGDMPLLVPGIGAQGGDLAAVIERGASSDGSGLVINSSRAVLYADANDAPAGARGAAAELVADMQRLLAEVTPDGTVV